MKVVFVSFWKKNLRFIKTVEGKWISPERIEEQFLCLEYIDQGFVFCLSIGKIAAILCISQEKYHHKLKIHADAPIDDYE